MDWRIIHGDSRVAVPDEEFELVFTSPPYNVGKEYAGHDDREVSPTSWLSTRPAGWLCLR